MGSYDNPLAIYIDGMTSIKSTEVYEVYGISKVYIRVYGKFVTFTKQGLVSQVIQLCS